MHVLALCGRIDMASIDKFNADVERAIAAAEQGKNVAVDLSAVDYISSAGLRLIMLVAKAARAGRSHAVLISPTPLVREILAISRFDVVLPVAGSRDEARRLFASPVA